MRRRSLIQLAGLSAVLPGCGGSGSGGGGGGDTPPPPADLPRNVLMIAIDDLNDWVGFLGGHPQVKTPHLDALAARSTAFTHAYCTAPVCSASRAGVLSGLSVQSTGVFANESTFGAVNPGKAEFDELLSGAGYSVQRFGKIDHRYAALEQPLPTPAPRNNTFCSAIKGEGAFDWAPLDVPDSGFPDFNYAAQGVDFLQAQPTDAPFCLSVGFVRTHVGWYVPRRFFDMYPLESIVVPNVPVDDLNDLGPTGKSIALMFNFQHCITGHSLWASAVRGYLASISWVDEQIGRLVAALDASPHAANTMVVLWSDHGFHLGEKFHWHKQALWEHATRVPCLVRMPGQTTGVKQAACISLRDLAPTILAHTRVTPAYAMDGQSLLPLLNKPDTAWTRPVLTTLDGIHHAVRTPEWRYIRYQSGEQELYDEIHDPEEFANIAGLASSKTVMADLERWMPARTV